MRLDPSNLGIGMGMGMMAGPPPGAPPAGGGPVPGGVAGAGGGAGLAPGPSPRTEVQETPPAIFAAVQEQLGLRLEPRKAPVDLVVIDHLEKVPTEN